MALQEALSLNKLKHRNILGIILLALLVRIDNVKRYIICIATLDTFISLMPSMQLCVVLEYCSEGDLSHYVTKMASGAVPGGLQVRLDLIAQLARGLEYLHSVARMIHRDLKPVNVLIQKGPIAKISDFGLSKALSDSSKAYTRTGTPYFMYYFDRTRSLYCDSHI